LLVKLLVKVLDTIVVGCDGDALDSLFNKRGGDLGFVFPDIILSEEELAVEVRYVNSI
jgi:hypothetical protein